MFVQNKETLIKSLEKMQRKQCCYDGYPDVDMRKPYMCDCKYGCKDMLAGRPTGEQTGCPELRSVIRLLKLLDDDEYIKLIVGDGNILI